MPLLSRPVRHALLKPLVDRLWWTGPAPGATEVRERILPTGRAQLIISAGHADSVMIGPTSKSVDIIRRGDRVTVGAAFRAGGAEPFVAVPSEELTDITITLRSVWALASLPDRMAELRADAALDLLEAELLQRLQPERVTPTVLAAERAIRAGRGAGAVAAWLGEDRRRLVPQFRRTVGVGPKHYERIRRFSRTVEAIRQPQPPSLATIAAELGYADQAHLTREFGHFAGVLPSQLLGSASGSLNHVDTDKIYKT
ncbi:helix-turn-helix domain-containing protein [Ruania alba]|uniref:AraC-type DNA-binding protein n=1 Tax=Ruania alba TaxID=648782 RepID=A0A1H5KEF5_9MICO|nr:helix-turn-helix domain-containing protein [Ruania alba]SEE63216.1 AraC-type DNA-binding protein [Ruania alba]